VPTGSESSAPTGVEDTEAGMRPPEPEILVEPFEEGAATDAPLLASRRSLASLVGVFIASRGLGLVREIGVAYYFGTSVAADRWSAAFAVAGVAAFFAGEATYAAAVRWLGDQPRAHPSPAYGFLLRTGVRAAGFASLGYAVLGPLVTVLVLGDFDSGWEKSAGLALLLTPWIGSSILAACVNAQLTLERRFVLINAAQVLFSAGSLIGLLAIEISGATLDAAPVAIGWSLGNLAGLAVVYLPTRRMRADAGAAAASLRGFAAVGLPVAVAYSLLSVQELTDRAIAARIGTGEVAALGYATRLLLLPIGFVMAALGPMVLSTLTSAKAGAQKQLSETAVAQLRVMARLLAPFAVAFAAVSPYLVSGLFEYGAFSAESTTETVAALDGLAIGVAAAGFSFLLFRAMQALAQLRELVVVGLFAVLANAILSLGLSLWLDLFGVTLATSIVAIGTSVIQMVLLARLLGAGSNQTDFLRASAPALAACLLAGALVGADRLDVISQDVRLWVGSAAALGLGAVLALPYARRRHR
jgi:putative peptidoglycan lipid II flippase